MEMPNTNVLEGINRALITNCSVKDTAIIGLWQQESYASVVGGTTEIRAFFVKDSARPGIVIKTTLTGIGQEVLDDVSTKKAILLISKGYDCSHPGGTGIYETRRDSANILKITTFDSAGGLVEGTYRLTLVHHATRDTIWIKGEFSVRRR